MAAKKRYEGEDIVVLEGLEPVRKRPGMYIGGVGMAGLHHLIWEVVDNSIDEAMNGHATEISVTLHKDGRKITVSDNGPGIPKENLSEIFNPFYTTRQGGSGLGLTMAYQIAQRFDGDLTASNRSSGGASFLLRLPLTRVRSSQQSLAGR